MMRVSVTVMRRCVWQGVGWKGERGVGEGGERAGGVRGDVSGGRERRMRG